MNTTEEIIEDLAQGKMVIIMDDEDRENEGFSHGRFIYTTSRH